MKKFTILHTEAASGWGGQERRSVSEAKGMRDRGHEVIFAVQKDGGIVEPLQREGFIVYQLPFARRNFLSCIWQLIKIINKHKVDIVNTHSPIDSWFASIAVRIMGRKIIRTRHISTRIKSGLNSLIVYNWLVSAVVTTCQETADKIKKQAKLRSKPCLSIPTGINLADVVADEQKTLSFRKKFGIAENDYLVGTTCILRHWKGINHLLDAAKILEKHPRLKWVIIGSGSDEKEMRRQWKKLGLEDRVIFTGYMENPFDAMAAMDIFVLLSTADEGVSQAILQAAALQKPLVATKTGGLCEVCIDGKTGFSVPVASPKDVANKIMKLLDDPALRDKMGRAAHKLVLNKFTFQKMLDDIELLYHSLYPTN